MIHEHIPDSLPRGMFYPLAIYMSADGGEWLIRDYAGQGGRFCVIGPWTTDIVASCRTLNEARGLIEKREPHGHWLYGIDQSGEKRKDRAT